MVDKQSILDGLLAKYNDSKVLYAKDVAKELGKPSAAAARALMNSPGFPIPVRPIGGRPTITVYDLANWLAGEPISPTGLPPDQPSPNPEPKSSPEAKAQPPQAARPPRESLGKYLALLRTQREFLEELYVELEAVLFEQEASERDLPPNQPLETRTDIL